MDLLDFWRREGLDEKVLWANWDGYYRIGLLQFALNNKSIEQHNLWLFSLLFNFLTQVRRINQHTDGQLPDTLDSWLTLNDRLYTDWVSKGCLPSTAPSVTFVGDVVGRLNDPISFPRDSAVYGAWRGLAEAISVIDKRMVDLETERRKTLLETHTLHRQLDRLAKLSFVQQRFASTLDRSEQQMTTLPGNE